MKVPVYNNSPIGSVDALARLLSIDSDQLRELASHQEICVKPNKPKPKPNGKVRQTYRIEEPLSTVHQQIKKKIFYAVTYPDYLQGGIKSEGDPKDYISNATYHSGRRFVNCEDISDFFSIHREKVS